MAQGLGALTEGFQSGYKFSTDTRRKKQIEKALDYELEGMHRKQRTADADTARAEETYGLGSLEKFSGAQPETYGSKLMGMFKGLFTRDKPQTALDTGAPVQGSVPGQPQASPVQQQPSPFGEFKDGGAIYMRDGGAVRHYANGGRSIMPDRSSGMRDHRRSTANTALPVGYADGGRAGRYVDPETGVEFIDGVPQGEVPADGGGFREGVEDVARNILPNTQRRFRESAGAIDAALERPVSQDRYAADVGSNVGRAAIETAKGPFNVARGVVEDTGIVDVARGVGGAFGYGTTQAADDEKAAAIRALDTNAPASDLAAQPELMGPDQTPGAAQGSPVAAAASPAAAPQEEEHDWASVNIMPEDMPSHSTKDWEKERGYAVRSAIANGQNPRTAMAEIDQQQMDGFNRFGQQAWQLLRAGNAPAAARALKAAYQFFPNGVDVRFGIQTGVNGQKVLIGMGVDEETGEPIKEGKPQVITAESLGVQLENMADPKAFRVWTKDKDQMEQALRKWEEVEKPKAQADLDLTTAQTQYYKDKGLAALLSAQSSGGRGGLKQADYDRAFSQFTEDRELQALLGGEDEAVARDLTAAMSAFYLKEPGDYPGVIRFIMQSYEQGGMEQVESDLVERGIL